MAVINLTQAAIKAGVTRKTLYKHIESGKLSVVDTADGTRGVDTAEISRVYGQRVTIPSSIHADNERLRGELLAARELLKAKDEHIQTLQRENLLLTVITQKATHQQQPPDNRGWFRKLFS